MSHTTTYTLGRVLRLTLELKEGRFGLMPEDLFSLAVRQNPKRAFLFVSKVLGKHLPIRPAALLAAGRMLALALDGQNEGQYWTELLREQEVSPFSQVTERLDQARRTLPLEERTLFIGFAETATGLARAVADCYDGEAAYISTTRMTLPGTEPLCFEESHSHASTHLLYLEPSSAFVRGCARAVLVDDELTTGNTALRLVRRLHESYGIRRFALLTLLDNSDGESRRMLEEELGVEIKMVALLQGRICQVESGQLPPSGLEDRRGGTQGTRSIRPMHPTAPGRTGRSLLSAEACAASRRRCRVVADRLGSQDKKTLFLGTGELIYEPALIAGYCGGWAVHSTTQSPVYALAGSAVQSGARFDPPDVYSSAGYLYNVPHGRYHRAVLLSEQEARAPKGLAQVAAYLHDRGIAEVSEVVL